jgi:hypothetical protein
MGWADSSDVLPEFEAFFNIELHNVGTATAGAVLVETGPGEAPNGIRIQSFANGNPMPPSTKRIVHIGVDEEVARKGPSVPLNFSYFDDGRERYWIDAFFLEIKGNEFALSASVEESFTRREFKRMVRRAHRPWRRPWLAWSLRSEDIVDLLADPDVRRTLAANVAKLRTLAVAWGRDREKVKGHLS